MSFIANNKEYFQKSLKYSSDVLSVANTQLGNYGITQSFYQWLIDNNLYDNLVLAVGSDYGVLKSEVSGVDYVNTAYDLSKFGNNPSQATAARQPILTSNGFNFVSDNLICANTDSFKLTGAHTMAFYIKVITGSANQQIIGKGRQGVVSNGGYIVGMASVNRIRYEFYSDAATSALVSTGVAGLISLNSWYHIVATWDGTQNANTQKIYINGVENNAKTSDVANIALQDTYLFNISSFGTGLYLLNSFVSEPMLFNTGFSQANVTSLYDFQKAKYGL